jgi:ribonuclease HI
MSKKQKYYVVWKGVTPGIYDTWEQCQVQVKGYEAAQYKSFFTLPEAEAAFGQNPWKILSNGGTKKVTKAKVVSNSSIIQNSLSVDAACSGNPGVMEYQGVHVQTREVWFSKKFPMGTNNIGEFLAIVHGLAELNQRSINIPVYTDSETALAWVKNKKCKTKLLEDETTKPLFELIKRAEKWLIENTWQQPLLKWHTASWGEIPADFGRK